MRIAAKVVAEWFSPWPASPPKGWHQTSFVPMKKVRKYQSIWRAHDGKRYPIETYARWIEEKDWAGKRHQIRSGVRNANIRMPFVLLNKKGTIYDGNHTMCVLIGKKYQGPILVVKHL